MSGWMINPRHPFSSVHGVVNGHIVTTGATQLRPDVERVLPWISHSMQSGFSLTLPDVRPGDRLEVLGRREDRTITRLETDLRLDVETRIPTPPADLLLRTCGASPEGFKADGLMHFTAFADAVRRYRPDPSVRRMLDWGCGCGRIGAHFLLNATSGEFFGCDIDAEAIGWCAEHITGGQFARISPYPPTPYGDHQFDLVIGYSVLTHLNRELQQSWLSEMRRILAPGGLFLATVHGRFAAQFAFPPRDNSLLQRIRHRIGVPVLLRSGFANAPEAALDGIAPDGFYSASFQTRAFTLREWSRHFEILDLIEGRMGYQDLVVMKRPGN